jgi:hypothetical protein
VASWNARTPGEPWGQAGSDFVAGGASSALSANHATGDVVAWDLTEDVQHYLLAPEENAGWLLKDSAEPAEGSGQVVRFHAREGSKPPRLCITVE